MVEGDIEKQPVDLLILFSVVAQTQQGCWNKILLHEPQILRGINKKVWLNKYWIQAKVSIMENLIYYCFVFSSSSKADGEKRGYITSLL